METTLFAGWPCASWKGFVGPGTMATASQEAQPCDAQPCSATCSYG